MEFLNIIRHFAMRYIKYKQYPYAIYKEGTSAVILTRPITLSWFVFFSGCTEDVTETLDHVTNIPIARPVV